MFFSRFFVAEETPNGGLFQLVILHETKPVCLKLKDLKGTSKFQFLRSIRSESPHDLIGL